MALTLLTNPAFHLAVGSCYPLQDGISLLECPSLSAPPLPLVPTCLPPASLLEAALMRLANSCNRFSRSSMNLERFGPGHWDRSSMKCCRLQHHARLSHQLPSQPRPSCPLICTCPAPLPHLSASAAPSPAGPAAPATPAAPRPQGPFQTARGSPGTCSPASRRPCWTGRRGRAPCGWLQTVQAHRCSFSDTEKQSSHSSCSQNSLQAKSTHISRRFCPDSDTGRCPSAGQGS